MEPQNAFKTIFGSKMMIFQKSSSRLHKTFIFEGGRVSLGAQNRPQEAPREDKTSQRRPQNPPKATFGSKKQANEAQESSKTNLEGAPKSPPRAPQRSPREPQNVFKTIFGSNTLISQTCEDSQNKNIVFESRRVSLGAQNRPQEVPEEDKKRHRKKKKEKQRQEEHQERQKERCLAPHARHPPRIEAQMGRATFGHQRSTEGAWRLWGDKGGFT